jgi:subtilisin family serine protease
MGGLLRRNGCKATPRLYAAIGNLVLPPQPDHQAQRLFYRLPLGGVSGNLLGFGHEGVIIDLDIGAHRPILVMCTVVQYYTHSVPSVGGTLMPVIFIVCAAHDRPFVEERLIRPLPALGFDQWVPSSIFEPNIATSIARAMQESAAVLVVVSASALASRYFADEVAAALACKTMVIALYLDKPDVIGDAPILRELRKVPGIAVPETMEPHDLWRMLAQLLPRPDSVRSPGELDNVATPIDWNEEIFSYLLKQTVGRHDFSRSEALVGRFSDHVKKRSDPYAAKHVNADLDTLKQQRQFLLMRRYASAAGVTDFKARRLYAQALIELKDSKRAEDVLLSLVEETTKAKDKERFEARGLLGRSYKQRYVDSGKPGDGRFLTQAIEAYWSVFREDEENVWHGINAASCILRANRDGIEAPPVQEAQVIANRVLDILDRRQAKSKEGSLDVWDLATRVEALVDLEKFEQASTWLDKYLTDPAMDAFQVSSTYRQFDEVLQLGKDSRGAPLLHRLAKAAERFRTGGLSQLDDKGARPMLVRVSDPRWAPEDIPDLVIHSRLGTVLSIGASDRTIKALLKDPVVIGIEESRPSWEVETARSLPFIGIAAQYQGSAGSFSESGGAALVAIVDAGIDVLHETFLDANGQSRLIGIWDQQDDSPPASPPPGFNFGRFHTQAQIANYVAQQTVPASLKGGACHGTHVASIAAGRKVGDFAGGVAPEAQLLIVISKGDQPTGYSHANLAALSFIDQMAESLNKPVVVNLSQGMNAGAHDGKSALETAFDEFSNGGRKPGRVVVKSAGNERVKRGHAKVTVPDGGAESLTWRCPPGPSRVQLELWWSSANQYRFRLTSPSGDPSEWVERKNPAPSGVFTNHGPFQLNFVERHPDNGDSLLKIVVNDAASPTPTEWSLDIEAVKVPAQGNIHAWIERGASPPEGFRPTEFTNHEDEEMTLSIPGTSYSVITVGAIDASKPIKVGTFSSYGPTRDNREKPDIAAPGVQVKAALRDSVQGVTVMDGTSMAAPHVTGAIALLLSRMARAGGPIPTATQIGAVLRQKTLNYSSRWDRGQGYGVLDVAALLDAF